MRTSSIRAVGTSSHRTDLDSHADTCVVSKATALIIKDYEIPVSVTGYKDGLGTEQCRTVTGVVAYDHFDGITYYLHFHQALEINGIKGNLICPMQLRANGLRVNDEPKHMVSNPTKYHHAITVPGASDRDELVIPLALQGVIHYYPTRQPTMDEYNSSKEEYHIDMTEQDVRWDPQRLDFEQAEASLLDYKGDIREDRHEITHSRMISVISQHDNIQSEDTLLDALRGSFGYDVSEKSVENNSQIVALRTSSRGTKVNATTLATRWGIGIESARRTLECTEQSAVRAYTSKLTRRYRTNDRKLRYRRLTTAMFSDTMKANVASWFRGNVYGQVFCTNFHWCRIFPMKAKSDAHKALPLLFNETGVPHTMIVDNALEQIHGNFRKRVSEVGAVLKQIEPYSPWQNAAEGCIRELKKATARAQAKAQSPLALWDHCIELQANIRSRTAHDNIELEGQVPETIITGQTADISPYVEHAWYDWVYAIDPIQSFPQDREILGRWLGPARDIGPAMCAKILKENGRILYASTYRGLTQAEVEDPELVKVRDNWNRSIKSKMVKGDSDSESPQGDLTPSYEAYKDTDHAGEPMPKVDDVDDVTPEFQDKYIGARVRVTRRGEPATGKVIKRARTEGGELFGKADANPAKDTREYDVEFEDGDVTPYTANIIAANMISEVDASGSTTILFDEIMDHKYDGNAVKKASTNPKKRNKQQRTTKGWKLLVKWKDGSTSWERLADIKESYPVKAAEYAIVKGIIHEPAFSWWAPHVLKTRDRIISKVASRVKKKNMKFGIEIPHTVERALEIDKEQGNTYWQDAINKEMSNVSVAFKVLDDNEPVPVGSQHMTCHMIFDVKLEIDGDTGTFRRKARLVAGGHMTVQPNVPTYASVVARDTVRIALTYAALNDLQVKAGDIKNAFITAVCEERIHTTLGPEFGPNAGKTAVIVRALYGLKSAAASFNRHLASCMRQLGYEACKADSDLWLKKKTGKDGKEYYSYVLLYVDDCLVIDEDAIAVLHSIDKFFPMKKGSIGDPDVYLGTKLRKVKLDNGVECWSMSPTKYVTEAIKTVKKHVLDKYGIRTLPKSGSGAWPNNYIAELDETNELDVQEANYYQSLIGVLHWMVEIGRVDIITETSVLASHMALPREGHLSAALHVFGYLDRKKNARMVYDPTYPKIDLSAFKTHDWERMYGKVNEAIPTNMPKPLGKPVDIRMWVDADFAGDKVRRRSRTGYFIYLNCAPVMWLSKRQSTCETSVFGAEFVALKQGIEALRGLRYKLRMMGIPIAGPSYVHCDNKSVVTNSSIPESMLNKKSNAVCYHACREAVAMGECLITHIPTEKNLADLGTKLMAGGAKRQGLVDRLLFDIESVSNVGMIKNDIHRTPANDSAVSKVNRVSFSRNVRVNTTVNGRVYEHKEKMKLK